MLSVSQHHCCVWLRSVIQYSNIAVLYVPAMGELVGLGVTVTLIVVVMVSGKFVCALQAMLDVCEGVVRVSSVSTTVMVEKIILQPLHIIIKTLLSRHCPCTNQSIMGDRLPLHW